MNPNTTLTNIDLGPKKLFEKYCTISLWRR